MMLRRNSGPRPAAFVIVRSFWYPVPTIYASAATKPPRGVDGAIKSVTNAAKGLHKWLASDGVLLDVHYAAGFAGFPDVVHPSAPVMALPGFLAAITAFRTLSPKASTCPANPSNASTGIVMTV